MFSAMYQRESQFYVQCYVSAGVTVLCSVLCISGSHSLLQSCGSSAWYLLSVTLFYAWNLQVAYRFSENMRTPNAEDTGVDLHVL